MAAAAVPEKIMTPSPPPLQHMHLSPSTSRRGLDLDSDGDAPPDRRSSIDLLSSSTSSPSRSSEAQLLDDLTEAQNQLAMKSEEYRQLFRLPSDEVLVQDFNCALQESFLLQGHMYLFGHSICFYSNLFGFETKRIIPFHEITAVRRAKAAAIFPTAIEIVAGGKKYFFTSFLSRDEAYKLINDGWQQHNGAAKESADLLSSMRNHGDISAKLMEPKSDLNILANGIVEGADSFRQTMEGAKSVGRNKDNMVQDDSKTLMNGEFEIASNPSGVQDNVEEETVIVQKTDCSSSGTSSGLKLEDSDAPRGPKEFKGLKNCFLDSTSEAFLVLFHLILCLKLYSVTVEKLFELFISDDSVAFQESFRRKCGDKGAKFSGCHEVQKYRCYRNSHLVIESSQEVSDVPFADYFRVEVMLVYGVTSKPRWIELPGNVPGGDDRHPWD
ncbi:hypothetical protein CQW23_02635 [Capsicum baccatum]|uniref:GRAM domain-containing protein n=1 Tax=Capsicum baccatum TaxID=33114 RepID=A0A2G2XS11_CAPBA|nr:hypothetical protein CQW23_02635 [Capsicum baccatum]